MYTISQQREIQDWYSLWPTINITRDGVQQLCRGPLKDFQNFLSKRGRPNDFVETMRTNIYLATGTTDKSISQEIDDTIFLDQYNKIKDLDEELKMLHAEVENKMERLYNPGEMKNWVQPSLGKKKFKKILADEIKEISFVLSALEESYLQSEPEVHEDELKNDRDKELLENLSNEAHCAFQSSVLQHYITDSSSHYPPSEKSAGSQFISLTSQLMNEPNYGKTVASWLRQEWLDHIQSCFRQSQQLQDNSSCNMSSKTHDTVVKWSQDHVQINVKNKTREELLNDAMKMVHSYQNACISNPNIGYRLSDFLSIIHRVTLEAQILRCRQHANKAMNPIQSIFNNISMDNCKSPMVTDEHVNSIMRNLETKSNSRPWVSTVAKHEQLQEIFIVLQKTWGPAKHKMSGMVSLAKETCDPLPTLLSRVGKGLPSNS